MEDDITEDTTNAFYFQRVTEIRVIVFCNNDAKSFV